MNTPALSFSSAMAGNFTHRYLKQSPSLSSAFTNCFIKPSLMYSGGRRTFSGFNNGSYLIFFHHLQTQFVWASLVSPSGLFLHGCPTNKERRDTLCILLVVPEACAKFSNLHKFFSCALNTLTSQPLVSCCHRILSFEPSNLWG